MSTEKLLMCNNFQERLKHLRKNRNKAEFARFLGIPAPMYHRYELGQIPKEDNLRIISERLNVSIDWLLTGREDITTTLSYSFRERLFEAKGTTGLSIPELAKILRTTPAEIEHLMNHGGAPSLELLNAFETHLQPLIDQRKNTPITEVISTADLSRTDSTLADLRAAVADIQSQLTTLTTLIDSALQLSSNHLNSNHIKKEPS